MKIKSECLGFKRRMWLVIIFVASHGLYSHAQESPRDQAIENLKGLAEKYYLSNHLSFDVTYRSAKEESPTTYLDSLKGSYKLSNNKYWYSLDSTEMIGMENVTVMLFKEDHIMYLSRPTKPKQSSNPLLMLDSFFYNNFNLDFQITESLTQKNITISSNEAGSFKRIEYVINKQSGLLEKMSYTVHISLLYDESIRSKMDKASSYVIVEVLFSNYQSTTFDTSIFTPENYFSLEGQHYLPTPQYQTYQIFLGSPNL